MQPGMVRDCGASCSPPLDAACRSEGSRTPGGACEPSGKPSVNCCSCSCSALRRSAQDVRAALLRSQQRLWQQLLAVRGPR